MKPLLQIFKKDPFWTVLILLAVVCALWFCLAREKFKAVWGKNPIVAGIIKEHNLVEQKSKFSSMGYYDPYFPYFAGIIVGIEQPKAERMDTYYSGKPYIFHLYYQKGVEMFPDNDAVHFLLGFCEYYEGHLDKARAQYETAIGLNPYFFWSYYNLGVIYFQQGDFFRSAVVFSKAFSVKKELTLEILSQSPFYWQLWRYITNPPQILGRNLNEGQEDAALLLAVYFVKTGAYDRALQIIKSAGASPWHQDLWKALHLKAVSKQKATDDIDRLIKEQIPVRLF